MIFRAFSVHSLSCEHIDTQVKEGDKNEGKMVGASKPRENTLHDVQVAKGSFLKIIQNFNILSI